MIADYTRLDVIVSETTYDLTFDAVAWREDEDGVGLPPIRRLTERGPQQHGVTDVGFRLDARPITLVLGMLARDESRYHDRRRDLLRIFRPSTSVIKLRWTLANGEVRQLDCYATGGLPMTLSERANRAHAGGFLGFYQRLPVALYAPDPLFYDPTQVTVTIEDADFAGLEVPMAVPLVVGPGSLDETATINYAGDWDEYPVIRINGPITNPVITNATTGETIDLTGASIAAGDYYDVDLRYGFKTVKDQDGTSRINYLTTDSDLGTWHLKANPVPDGTTYANSITAAGTDTNDQTSIVISYYNRYIGF